jgi:DNA-binding PadR family transcriptional regulator
LELKGWIVSKWETSEMNRKAKFYRLTAAGRKHLAQEHSKWAEFVTAVANVMGPVPVPAAKNTGKG